MTPRRASINQGGAIAAAALVLGVAALAPPSIPAAPGDRDAGFSRDGKVELDFNEATEPQAIAVDRRGRTVVFGQGVPKGTFVARYTADGVLDKSFSGDGFLYSTAFGSPPDVGDLEVLDDGSIVVSGFDYQTSPAQYRIARFNPDGSPDRSFDGDGVVDLDPALVVRGLAVQPDGSIVFTGWLQDDSDLIVGRLLSDGRFDSGFAGDGTFQTDLGRQRALGEDAAITEDGRIVIGGVVTLPLESGLFALRLEPTGALDSSFSGDGVAEIPLGGSGEASSVALTPDGGVVVGGDAGNRPRTVQFSGTGEQVNAFAIDGLDSSRFRAAGEEDIAVDNNGAIYRAGSRTRCVEGGFCNNEVLVARLDPDGSPDETFGREGIASMTATDEHHVHALAVGSDGKPVLASSKFNYEAEAFLVRYRVDAGRSDADADGVADQSDACPSAFGPPRGCPSVSRHILTFERPRPGFRVRSPSAECEARQPITLVQVRNGPDKRFRERRADEWGEFRIPLRFTRGTFRAEVNEARERRAGICVAAKSELVRLKPKN